MLNTKLQFVLLAGGPSAIYSDSFTRGDGDAGGRWIGAGSLLVAGNVARIVPVKESNLLTDPDLEGTYTAGLAAPFTKGGSPTVAQSAVAHSGSKAQQFAATVASDYVRFGTFAGVNGRHYVFTGHGRRNSGTGTRTGMSFTQTSGYSPGTQYYQMDGNYMEAEITNRAQGTGMMNPFSILAGTSSFTDQVVGDDYSLNVLTQANLFKLVKGALSRVVVAAKIYLPHAQLRAGIVLCADDPANVQNGIVAWIDRITLRVDQILAGTWTTLSSTTTWTYADWAPLQLTFDGTNVQLAYNGSNVGTPIALSEAGIINNKYHGLYFLSEKALFGGFGFAPSGQSVTLPTRNAATVTGDGAYNAFPGLAKSGSNLVAVYRKGTSHQDDNGVIVQRISTDNGSSWGAETTIATDATYDVRDPSIAVLTGGTLLLTYSRWNTAGLHIDVKCKRSTDGGATWSAAIDVTTSFTDWAVSTSRAIEDSSGNVLLACYGEDTGDTFASSRISVSADGGLTWSAGAEIADGQAASKQYYEPELVRTSGANIICLIRNSTDANISASFSTNDGATWGALASKITGTSVAHSELLTSGRLVTLFRFGSLGARIASSPDAGINWYPVQYPIDPTYQTMYAVPVDLGGGLIGCLYSLQISTSRADMFWQIVPEARLIQD